MAKPIRDTRGEDYPLRLEELGGASWKRWLNVQAPYRWNLRRLDLGRTLELGCGIGRNLLHLGRRAVGVDHNADCVAAARRRGCNAYLPEEFRASPLARARFDSLLFAHVLEHGTFAEAKILLAEYLEFLRPAGRAVFITPQEAGFQSDPTHVEFMDFARLHELLASQGLEAQRAYSFPFPRAAGRFFVHNEFVVVGTQNVGFERRMNPNRGASSESLAERAKDLF